MEKIEFTDEELNYIETNFDIIASNLENRIRLNIEQYTMVKAMDEKELCKIVMDNVLELGQAQLITRSIRNKLEKWRKQWDGKKT